MKKIFKWFVYFIAGLIALSIIVAVFDISKNGLDSDAKSTDLAKGDKSLEKPAKEESKETVTVEKSKEIVTEDTSTINTSVFEYAKSVEITDARDITKHITLKIDLSNDADAGTGTLNVLKQSYAFLQQEDIQGSETVTIFVRVNELKVSQFNIRVNDFHPNKTDSIASLVLAAADIEFLTPEVEEFGKAMELW